LSLLALWLTRTAVIAILAAQHFERSVPGGAREIDRRSQQGKRLAVRLGRGITRETLVVVERKA
jgi:hypothetical protein